MDRATRLRIANAFRVAKKRLWKGSRNDDGVPLFGFICFALDGVPGGYEARWVVQHRIGGNFSLEAWLQLQGFSPYRESSLVRQAYRQRWLDALIKEFES
jgi:hypothetical protein